MTFATRIPTLLLAGLLAVTGTAAAQGSTLQGDWLLETDDRALGGEAGLFEEDRYADLDAVALSDEASASLDTDASASDLEQAADGNAWTWLELRFSAVLDALRGLAGLDVPADADANVEVYAGADGVDVDANIGDTVFDDSPAGDADGVTYQAVATAKGGADLVPS